MKRLLGLMLMLLGAASAQATTVIPAVYVTTTCATPACINTFATNWFITNFGRTLPGYPPNTVVGSLGYSGATADTYLVVSSTTQPISNVYFAVTNYLGIPQTVAYYAETGVVELSVDNALYARATGIQRSKCCGANTLSTLTPSGLDAWVALSYSTNSIINGGYPKSVNGVGLGVPPMLGANCTDLNTGLPFTIFEGESFIAVDKNNWSVRVTYKNGKFTADPNSVTDASGKKCPVVNGKFTSPGTPPAPTTPNNNVTVPNFAPGSDPGTILWPLPTNPPGGSGCIDDGSGGPQSCKKSGIIQIPVLPF